MTIDAIISANKMEQAFHFPLRTITNEAIADTNIVRTVARVVMISEFLNTFQKSIFLMASGKFFKVNP